MVHAFLSYPGQGMWLAEIPAGGGEFEPASFIATADDDEHEGSENPWPGVAVDRDDRAYVVRAENRGAATGSHVVLARSEGGAWIVEDLTDGAAIDADGKPAITAVGKDVFVVWRTRQGTLVMAEIAYAGRGARLAGDASACTSPRAGIVRHRHKSAVLLCSEPES